ncbi:type 1 fimbrial protein [Escherichia albertii]|uniref:fimbrial protein n=1 Tax=Escherichia albertii TaxID=208962 RepID=UPI0017B4B250|nr:fimbrial protein [Escherichia albertii]EFO1000708.1 type 1 fimbrial protein [Escherichia albertii]ELY3289405.1 type 1 fimbrial protein [Escherichia albertii]MCU7311479.1 type 1 fimbrial protein [Escherichia albertii]MCZ9159482.1 fimbrial protein [Escherichia albertii]
MKKTIISLAVVSSLLSGSAMADLTGGQADNSASTATLNFSGKVTSSLCQINTSELTKTISLGEASAAALATGGQSPFQSFTVGLSNCDPTTANITYTIRDGNGLPGQSANESDYLIPKSGDTSASGVGVYIADSEHKPIKIGANQTAGVTQVGGQAESEQTIALTAYIKAVNDYKNVKPGVVDATGIMTIKAAAAGDA